MFALRHKVCSPNCTRALREGANISETRSDPQAYLLLSYEASTQERNEITRIHNTK